MTEIPSIFSNVHISWIWFTIIVIFTVLGLVLFGGYLIWTYHLGKPLAPFLWARLKSWSNPNLALFEIFTLTNNMYMEYAQRETGDGYRLLGSSIPKQKVIKPKESWMDKRTKAVFVASILAAMSSWFLLLAYTDFNLTLSTELVGLWAAVPAMYMYAKKPAQIQQQVLVVPQQQHYTNQKHGLIVPKSTYSVNSVNTVLAWDLHPKLHEDVKKGIAVLISNKIYTLDDLEFMLSNSDSSNQILFDGYTYLKFYELYMATKKKYSMQVTVKDVVGFMDTVDSNFRESIVAKDYNAMVKKKSNNQYMKYAIISVILAVLFVGFRLVYVTMYGGKP